MVLGLRLRAVGIRRAGSENFTAGSVGVQAGGSVEGVRRYGCKARAPVMIFSHWSAGPGSVLLVWMW